jgi:hypothetical protein
MAEGRIDYNSLGHCISKLVRTLWKRLTREIEFTLEEDICILISINMKKHP